MTNISESIRVSAESLKLCEIPKPFREAKSLLLLAIHKNKAFLIAHPEYQLKEDEEKAFWDYIERRSRHEPFQHIAGKQEFWGLDFVVSPEVLIPRPETELIVEAGIEILKDRENPKFCEVGIGSGCISVSILHDVKNATAIGLDISPEALKIARLNAENNQVSDRLTLKNSDVFSKIKRTTEFDLIVSNPPYIPARDLPDLQAEVRDFDPHIALTDGKDGLSIIEKIIKRSPKYLKPNGFLLLEMGYNQSNDVGQMFDQTIWQEVNFFPDLQGIPRMVKARLGKNLVI